MSPEQGQEQGEKKAGLSAQQIAVIVVLTGLLAGVVSSVVDHFDGDEDKSGTEKLLDEPEPEPDPEERPPVIINNGSVDLSPWDKHGGGPAAWKKVKDEDPKVWFIEHRNPPPVALQLDEAKAKGRKSTVCTHADFGQFKFPLPITSLAGQDVTLTFDRPMGKEKIIMRIGDKGLEFVFEQDVEPESGTLLFKRPSVDGSAWALTIGKYTCAFSATEGKLGKKKTPTLYLYQLK